MQFTVYNMPYTVYNIQFMAYSIQYTVYSMQYTAYSKVQYAVWSQYTAEIWDLLFFLRLKKQKKIAD